MSDNPIRGSTATAQDKKQVPDAAQELTAEELDQVSGGVLPTFDEKTNSSSTTDDPSKDGFKKSY